MKQPGSCRSHLPLRIPRRPESGGMSDGGVGVGVEKGGVTVGRGYVTTGALLGESGP